MNYEQLTLYDEVNMDGKGTYQIVDLMDEIHGERHCTNCGYNIKVWREVW
jgi:predicted nucleic-acid-binding Zn-ribbon protein